MSSGPVGVAVVGAGVISNEYLKNLTRFPDVRVLGIADIDTDRAREAARQYQVPVSGDVETVLAVDEVEIVVNLTIPAAHASVALAAVQAGKHVYGEKPLATTPAEGEKVLAEAERRGLRVGNAPDTFLGAGLQAAKRAVDTGVIGAPIAAATVMLSPGPESWHPSPEFLFQRGAGPLFDIGPYYLTSLVALLGPVVRVAASARQGRAQRVIGSGPKAGTVFDVEVPTHVSALIDFAAGENAVSTFSFDSPVRRTQFEITGTEGTLWVPDPNTFAGPLRVQAVKDDDWRDLPVPEIDTSRGRGVLDMARAIRENRPHRASGALAQHVLETMTAIAESAEQGAPRTLTSTCPAPDALPTDWDPLAATVG